MPEKTYKDDFNRIERDSATNRPMILTRSASNINPGNDVPSIDRFLPIANVSRIMKRALPTHAKISKEAKETVQECVSEFISFITGEAAEKCRSEKRKTVNGDDLLWAMNRLDFSPYTVPLKIYLEKYRESEGVKSNTFSSYQTLDSQQQQLQQQQRQSPLAHQLQTNRMSMDTYGASSSGTGLEIDNCNNDYGNDCTGMMDPNAHYAYPTIGEIGYSISNVVGGYDLSESSLYGGLDPSICRSNNEVGNLNNEGDMFPTLQGGFDTMTDEGDLMAKFSIKIGEENENDGTENDDIENDDIKNYLYDPDTSPKIEPPSPGK
ncbi:hypothetical protein ZOSMA_57G00660 [Zostera marina]|uniref:Transcription factor CBF/NF-Y/archaeal histone domain-containing protein n=1 Tax=Zostera marina TaxID=29655 RepID=A0A0K9NVE6_ZOSMR|nr:hypothetical protein ZOSMA_57G00660 [Zostera marina]